MWTCTCGFECDRKFNMERHMVTKGHQLKSDGSGENDGKSEKELKVFECTTCNYVTSIKSNFNKHERSSRHGMRKRIEESTKAPTEASSSVTEGDDATTSRPVYLNDVMDMFMKFSSEERAERIKNTEMFKSLVERILTSQQQQQPPPQTVVIQQPAMQNVVLETNNSMSNSNNTTTNKSKHFNLNFYLNEECKNAMNMSDFINSVVISMEDLEHLGTVGYEQGMQRILTKALKEKEKTELPMHCSDVKREVIYVRKNDAWTKDETKEETEMLIRHIYRKNLRKMKEWGDEHPEYQVSDSPEYEYWYSITRNMCNTNPNAMKKLVSHLAQLTAIEKSTELHPR